MLNDPISAYDLCSDCNDCNNEQYKNDIAQAELTIQAFRLAGPGQIKAPGQHRAPDKGSKPVWPERKHKGNVLPDLRYLCINNVKSLSCNNRGCQIKSLEAALEKFGYLDAKFLLVGHSLGGFYNRVFAARHSEQVKGIIFLDPRIPSYEDMKFARNIFQTYSRKDFEPDNMNLYYLLANMEHTSDFVRQVPLSPSIPLLDIMAEIGPFSDATENERFKADQRNLVNENKYRRLLLAEGSSHNIPDDKPGLVIDQIVDFYREHLIED